MTKTYESAAGIHADTDRYTITSMGMPRTDQHNFNDNTIGQTCILRT